MRLLGMSRHLLQQTHHPLRLGLHAIRRRTLQNFLQIRPHRRSLPVIGHEAPGEDFHGCPRPGQFHDALEGVIITVLMEDARTEIAPVEDVVNHSADGLPCVWAWREDTGFPATFSLPARL
jgi:hypothetical protein